MIIITIIPILFKKGKEEVLGIISSYLNEDKDAYETKNNFR